MADKDNLELQWKELRLFCQKNGADGHGHSYLISHLIAQKEAILNFYTRG